MCERKADSALWQEAKVTINIAEECPSTPDQINAVVLLRKNRGKHYLLLFVEVAQTMLREPRGA